MAPFKPKDADLFSIISSFDAAYSAYNGYQGAMERFWTLKYLQQNAITEINATVFKENMVRADELPLVLPVVGAQGLARGARLRVKLGQIDEVTLDVTGTVLARLDALPANDNSALDCGEDEVDENVAVGPIAIAVDKNDADAGASAAASNESAS